MPVCTSCGRESAGEFAFCPHCGSALSPTSAREQRKTVTILFCDVVGSTALGEATDPEALRALLTSFFERMREIIEHHGGTVEKYIGDAVMSVFGVPVVHEDDALRAVRAAAEMRAAVPEFGLQTRIGVNTGEVMAVTEEWLATGDAVNVAARLEQAAGPMEILLGAPTLALVRDAVDVESLEPLDLKGKSQPMPAYRLLSVREMPERSHDTRFVGREREVALLRDAWQRALADERCEGVTILGDAGVGKSRLIQEALASVDGRIVHGRCLPYGEGITYWSVVEVIKQLDALPSDPRAAAAIQSLLGVDEAASTSAEEIAWAFRKLLEEQAPLVCVFDDIQWGEETFLDLVEHITLLSSGATILLVCMARPELVERRPAWPVTLRLEPLPDADVTRLIGERLPIELRERIAHAAGGNPLFVSEMVAMAGQADGEVVVPATLKALLAARLDQLEPPERRVLERGSIEGEIFHRGAMQALAPEETQITPRLAALVRKELIRPDRAQLAGDDGFRFRHLLIRDAAYEALPKATRADLHARFAAWLGEHGSALVELDEILGYHLEQAAGYLAELGSPDEQLAAAARERLAAAGHRALSRLDYPAAVHLLERALALVPAGEIASELEWGRMVALIFLGRPQEGHAAAKAVTERAREAGDDVAERCGRIEQELFLLLVQPWAGSAEKLVEATNAALPIFEAAGDDFGLHLAYFLLGEGAQIRGLNAEMLAADERALFHARRAGLNHYPWIEKTLGEAYVWGATPLSDALAWLDEHEPEGRWQRSLRGIALLMAGRLDEARALLTEQRAEAVDHGALMGMASASAWLGRLELLAGNAAAAAELSEEACRLLEQAENWGHLSTQAGWHAQSLYALGRLEDADPWVARSEELAAPDDPVTQMLWRQVKAKLLACRGDRAEAERVAREAVAIGEETDQLYDTANAYADLAEVVGLAGKTSDTCQALERALELYERKGSVLLAERTRELLTATSV